MESEVVNLPNLQAQVNNIGDIGRKTRKPLNEATWVSNSQLIFLIKNLSEVSFFHSNLC